MLKLINDLMIFNDLVTLSYLCTAAKSSIFNRGPKIEH